MIAVITTVRDGLPFLVENLVSVAAQAETKCVHVVVDDGSTDGTAAWLEGNWKTRIDLILSEQVGRSQALNPVAGPLKRRLSLFWMLMTLRRQCG